MGGDDELDPREHLAEKRQNDLLQFQMQVCLDFVDQHDSVRFVGPVTDLVPHPFATDQQFGQHQQGGHVAVGQFAKTERVPVAQPNPKVETFRLEFKNHARVIEDRAQPRFEGTEPIHDLRHLGVVPIGEREGLFRTLVDQELEQLLAGVRFNLQTAGLGFDPLWPANLGDFQTSKRPEIQQHRERVASGYSA